MYSGGNLKLYITPVKFYFPYYLNFNALAIQCVTTLPLYHFTIWKCTTLPLYTAKVYPVSSVCRLSIALLSTLISPYSNEKRLYDILYHNHIKTSVWAFKRFISICIFYITQNLSHTISVAFCRCAFYAVYSLHLQAIVITLIYSYTNSINTLKKQNTRLLWNS